ncbi:MAG: stage II sporulation protein R [Clostridia bacterium]|nr:stage II sporulation protein R [Clostridia bacterium]
MAFLFNDDLVRLHVLAASDGQSAQRLKMRVVMAVRRYAARLVCRAVDAGEAFEILSKKTREIARRARITAMMSGYFGRVKVECGVYPFPDCDYADMRLARGDYRAVRVSIGKGAGHNWWCVLYPELCAVEQSVAEVLMGSGSVEFYSSIAQFFENLLSVVGL